MACVVSSTERNCSKEKEKNKWENRCHSHSYRMHGYCDSYLRTFHLTHLQVNSKILGKKQNRHLQLNSTLI